MNAPSFERCPVCGYDLAFEPWHGDLPADEICPSCGIQFGYDDAAGGRPEARREVYDSWRERWIRDGMRWASVGRLAPVGWDPERQLQRTADREIPRVHQAPEGRVNGHSDRGQSLGTVLWPDAEVEGITIDYDAFLLSIKESTGLAKTIRGQGYIGFRMLGMWDEVIVETAELRSDHPMIHECLKNMSDRANLCALSAVARRERMGDGS